jgi:hypothetical protein
LSDKQNFEVSKIEVSKIEVSKIEFCYKRNIGYSRALSAGDILHLIVCTENDAPGEARGTVSCEIKDVHEGTITDELVSGSVTLHVLSGELEMPS